MSEDSGAKSRNGYICNGCTGSKSIHQKLTGKHKKMVQTLYRLQEKLLTT